MFLHLTLSAILFGQTADPIVDFEIDPPRLELRGPTATQSILVQGKTSTGRLVDGTRLVKLTPAKPGIVDWQSPARFVSRSNGTVDITVEWEGIRKTLPVTVLERDRPRDFHYERDIAPLLNRFGCNSSACHAQAEGQNGFKLSVFGFDTFADHNALVKEARGRRVFPASPEGSLILLKASGKMSHGGGIRLKPNSAEYQTVHEWIAAGAPFGNSPEAESIRVEPSEKLMAMNGRQQLRIWAKYADGRETDVTHLAKFQPTQEGLAVVDTEGGVTLGTTPGEVAVMAQFMGNVAIFRALVPRGETISNYPEVPSFNFIDDFITARLKKLNILPSEVADDAEYLRRVYLDIVGTLPTPAEARRFLRSNEPKKRAKLVDELLDRPEYADVWALQWSDILRVDRQVLRHKRAYALYRWIHTSFAENKPYDQFVREFLTSEGPLDEVGPANFFKVVTKPGEAASSVAQIFLGIRIACAECHHHPFDRWSQTDYFGMQAFSTPLNLKAGSRGESLIPQGNPQTKHPRTGTTIQPHALGTKMPDEVASGDRRPVLADWMTDAKNPWFARNLANRVWSHFLGRGLIEQVDDVRATNPPSNPELLDALAKHVVETRFDIKKLIRTITQSRTYQLSSRPNTTNEKDTLNHSRAAFRRLHAEVLLDIVSQVTGIAEKLPGMPPNVRAIQLWDSKVSHYFLKLYGRPQRLSACECERVHEPTVSQVLHLLNSSEIQSKLSHERGQVATLVREKTKDADLVEELYLLYFSRFPSADERAKAVTYFESGNRRQAAEDLAWTLMNSLEFVFNH